MFSLYPDKVRKKIENGINQTLNQDDKFVSGLESREYTNYVYKRLEKVLRRMYGALVIKVLDIRCNYSSISLIIELYEADNYLRTEETYKFVISHNKCLDKVIVNIDLTLIKIQKIKLEVLDLDKKAPITVLDKLSEAFRYNAWTE
jgi:hypothetical protein